jgi:hypothetical protein
MKYQNVLRAFVLGLALLALATLPQSASASVIGHLSFANCDGLGVVVTLTTVDWLPAGGGTGCIAAGIGTTVTFDTGSITPAEHGTVNDLSAGVGNTGFLTFAGVTFDLASDGPGVSNIACVNTFNPSDPACSVFTGSPFVLTPGSTGTSVSFAVRGLAIDATSTNSPWSGAFTTQIAGVTPLDIQNAILAKNGSFQATYSFDGNVGIPEPVSLTLIGFGLIAFAGLKRRKSRP